MGSIGSQLIECEVALYFLKYLYVSYCVKCGKQRREKEQRGVERGEPAPKGVYPTRLNVVCESVIYVSMYLFVLIQ